MFTEPTPASTISTVTWDTRDPGWITQNIELYGWSAVPEKDIEFENPEYQEHLLKGEKLLQCNRCKTKRWFPHDSGLWYSWCNCLNTTMVEYTLGSIDPTDTTVIVDSTTQLVYSLNASTESITANTTEVR